MAIRSHLNFLGKVDGRKLLRRRCRRLPAGSGFSNSFIPRLLKKQPGRCFVAGDEKERPVSSPKDYQTSPRSAKKRFECKS